MKKNILNYSHSFEERIDSTLSDLNSSIEQELKNNELLKNFKEIEFEIKGSVEKNNLALYVNYITRSGLEGNKIFTSHVDDGAIEAHKEWLLAFYGESKVQDIEEILEKEGNVLDVDYLKENEPILYEQLSKEYLLLCSPNTIGGSEFTKEDQKFFEDIILSIKTQSVMGEEVLYINPDNGEQIELYYENNKKKLVVVYEDGFKTNFPVHYGSGKIGLDNPEHISRATIDKIKELCLIHNI